MKNVTKKEDRILNGGVLSTLLILSLPLFVNHLLELIYSIFDTFVLSATGIGDPGSVVLFSQIKNLLSSVGGGIISGASILIASYIGRDEKHKARMVITQTLYVLSIFSVFCATIFIGFGKSFLRLLNTPISMINSSYGYYVALIISLIIGLINSLYSTILIAKGDTKKVLSYKTISILTKVILSSFIVFSNIFKNVTSTYLAIATIISELTMFFPALMYLFSKKSELGLIKENPHKKMILKICKLSLPIILGGIVFNLTKVIMNSIIVNSFGSFVLTFLGLEGLFFGVFTKYITAIKGASSTMVGQAMGAKKINRVISVYKYSLIITVLMGILNFAFFHLFKEPISLFALNNDLDLSKKLIDFMYVYFISVFFSPILEVAVSYLNSLRITKPKLLADSLRTIILRLPLLIFLIYFTNYGYLSVAFVFTFSNTLTAIIMITISIVITKRLQKKVNTN